MPSEDELGSLALSPSSRFERLPPACVAVSQRRRCGTPGEGHILIPAALEGQITSDNAARIKAPLIVEAANGPEAVGAAAILSEAGNVIMPDLFVNAGGVRVSHSEWIKDLQLMKFGRRGRSLLETRQESCAGVLEGKLGREICDKGDDSLDPHRLVGGMSRVKGTGAGRPREGGRSGVVRDGCCEFVLARIQSVFTERTRGIDQPLTPWADPSSMETRVFIDDGYPESREYNDNYCLVGDPEAERHFQGWTQVNAPVGERGVLLQRLVAAMRSATRLLLPGDFAGSPSKERGPAPPLGRLVARVEGAATLEGPAAAGEGSDPSRDLAERGVLGGGRRVG